MVRLIEVGPRDGLQNERTPIPTGAKAEFVRRLRDSGLLEIEATSFVSPKWIAQLGDAEQLWPLLEPGGLYSALVPNVKGLERALACGVGRVSVFTAASDAFAARNINMTVEESIVAIEAVHAAFRTARPAGFFRAYVSTAFECPYAGKVEPERTTDIAWRLIDLGADEVSIGDTIGVAAPPEVERLTRALLAEIPAERIAYHFHDTRGTAVANVARAFGMGIRSFDASAAGLGGCPYAPGAGGNVATEDLVYLFQRMGEPTGVDPVRLARASLPILEALGRPPTAKAQLAALASEARG